MAADQAPSHVLVVQFVAALLQRTLGCPTVEAHQHALQRIFPWAAFSYLVMNKRVKYDFVGRS
jgi:hypothetical protein